MYSIIAGGAGFIGCHLCEQLLLEGNEVICLDNLITGRRLNIERLLNNSSFTFIQHDIINELPSFPPVDYIFHLASPASPPGYQRNPIETLRVNSEGTRRLLDLAISNNARFLYASTSEIYGDPLVHPQIETYRGNVSSIGPRSMYDEAKRYGEALTMAYVRTHNVDARIVRIFNTYGPYSDPLDGRMVPNFVIQALSGEDITVYSDGSQTRSLCYVSDLVDGLIKTMISNKVKGEVINLGNSEEHSVLEYANLILSLTGSSSEIVFTEPAVGDDPQRRQPVIDKAREILNWEPQISLREGLRQTIDYFRDEIRLQYRYMNNITDQE